MAKTLHAGIIPGAEAKKLYSYPTLSASSDTFLMGSGSWADADNITVGTAKQAVKLQTPVDLAGYEFDGTQSIGRYARCNTGGSEPIKKISDLPGFTASAGAWLILWLGQDNTAVNPQLQIGDAAPIPFVENLTGSGNTPVPFDTEAAAARIVHGAYIIFRSKVSNTWMIASGPAGYYRTATQTANGFMSKDDKKAHDTMVSALNNPCTTSIDSNGCLVVKLYGSNIPFITIDKAGEW